MKNSTTRTIYFSLCFIMASVMSHSAFAKDSKNTFFGKQAKGKWIVGIKAAKIDNNVEEINDSNAIGLILGYEFDKPIGGSGTSTIEFEYLTGDETISVGNESDDFVSNISTEGLGLASYNTDILSLFFTYRSAGTIYYKVKAGFTYSDVEIASSTFTDSNEDIALAGGIGIGYHVGDFGVVELDYTANSGENDLGILGLNALLEF